MKKQVMAMVVAGLMASGMVSAANAIGPSPASSTTTTGGTIHFIGEVVTTPCAIPARDAHKIVLLDQVKARRMGESETVAGQPQKFSLHLMDCDLDTYTQAAFTFTGVAATGYSNILANEAGVGGAEHVGLVLQDDTGKAVTLGTPLTAKTLQENKNTFDFMVDYSSTDAPATAGAVVSSATFSITYS